MAHQGIYYPNPYPHSQASIQPHSSSNAQHAPDQHYARPSSSFMPPPTLPEDVNRWRNLQPQRPSNLWPQVTEEQRQLQDRYSQNAQTSPINPYYAQQPTSTTAAAIVPSISFDPPSGAQTGQYPSQLPQAPASTFHSAPSMTATTLPSESAAQEPRKPSAPQPVNTRQPATTPSAAAQNPSQQPPAQSPTAAPSALEAARVTALLDINRLLLHSIVSLQTYSKPTTADVSDTADPSKLVQPQQARPGHLSNPFYSDYMRRLQSNLAYLACIADRGHKPQNPIPAFPAIMETPAQRKAEAEAEGDEEREKELRQKYEGLKELWPDWKGDMKKG